MEIQIPGFQCLRCGHQWIARKGVTPKRCSFCKSPYWDRPRRGEATQAQDRAPREDWISEEEMKGPARKGQSIEIAKPAPPVDTTDDDLMGIWKGSGPENEVEAFLAWRRSEGRQEAGNSE